jgi:hypothetical protein
MSLGRQALSAAILIPIALGSARAGEPVRHVVVYAEQGRFAGWPANHGMWSWGDELLVGFSRGYDRDRGSDHHIDHDRPEECLLARSRDGGRSWAVETPRPAGALIGTRGMRHGLVPSDQPAERPTAPVEPIDFTHPDLAWTLRMENVNNGVSRHYVSYDRGRTWRGPYRLPLFGQPGVMARTDYLVEGPRTALLSLTASKANGREGRPFAARTTDGGLTWMFLGFIGPEPSGYAIMPSTVRLGPADLLTTVRRKDGDTSWIDAYASRDDGRTWWYLATPDPDTGEGNPPSLPRLPDGRLCLTYGRRAPPFRILARLSADGGKTWSDPKVLRDDGAARDLGYVRSAVRTDGAVVAAYYFNDRSRPERYLAATIWTP